MRRSGNLMIPPTKYACSKRRWRIFRRGAETIQSSWQNPSDTNEAMELVEQLEKFDERLVPIQKSIEYANDQESVFASSSVIVSHALLAKLEDLNARWKVLQVAVDERYQLVANVLLRMRKVQRENPNLKGIIESVSSEKTSNNEYA
ncbi:hypothetical protein K0M31_016163 [Melipona bicolor]|uniref:Dystrophin n=1 Tax=Melipona bicolor TaxID=60889 RepID=A0AA40G6I3_9HYME|nr:hypothetical protein K0M31_016163 [Melipona bicolor]